MNQRDNVFVAGIVVVCLAVVACAGPRHAQRRERQPDSAHSALYTHGGVDGAPRTDEPQRPVVEVIGGDAEVGEAALSAEDSLRAVLDRLLSGDVCKFSQCAVRVLDLTSGTTLYERNSLQRMRPASAEKVVTAIAALDVLGPSYTFATRLLTTGKLEDGGVLRGDLFIKGGMDPLLTVADVRSLVAQLKEAGVRQVRGRLLADASLKDSDELGWGWCWDDENPVLTPLLVGGKPGLADQLQTALRQAGINVSVPMVMPGTAPASARELAVVRRPLREVLQPMLKQSDNLCAESVFYQLGATRKTSARVVADVMRRSGDVEGSPQVVVADGSGLSLYNYQTAMSFTSLLAYAATRPDSILAPLTEALPIAAVDGTLKKRMATTPAAANVRAKTGSVTAVSTLVGYTRQLSTGHLMAFAILNQGVETMAQGRALQDSICVVLSR